MSKRDHFIAFYGAHAAFAVVAATDGHWIAALIFFAIAIALRLKAGAKQEGIKA